MEKATAVVAMGGYNTFCEILSLDKRALIVPRTQPRLEQHIRAVEAERLGLVRMLSERRRAGATRAHGRGAASAAGPAAARPRCISRACSTGSTCIRARFARVLDEPAALQPLTRRPSRAFMTSGMVGGRIAVVVKGYPRLSETFIAQEILALEERGIALGDLVAAPSDRAASPSDAPAHRRPVRYLPEYLYREPLRVLRGLAWAAAQPRFGRLLRLFWRDLRRDLTANRGRRLGQALVFARELPAGSSARPRPLPAHARLGRTLRGNPDRPDLELFGARQGHLDDAGLGEAGEDRGRALGRDLHGAGRRASHRACRKPRTGHACLSRARPFPVPLRLRRTGRPGTAAILPTRCGSCRSGARSRRRGTTIFCKALAALPADLHWRFAHVGGGELLEELKARAGRSAVAGRIAFLGAQAQPES